ncbi:MAG: YceI family protein [Anaerolineaceae bacterium]|nr:MAG: YceI family protein [Anaerolineaceae bacterium]
MNKRSISMFLLITAVLIVALAGCKSTAAEPDRETAVSEAPLTPDSTKPEATLTPAPTETAGFLEIPSAAASITPTIIPTDEPAPTEPTATSGPLPEPGVLRTFELVPEDSEVRFLIDEELLGSPKTVVGRTNRVSGEILLDLKNPQEVEVGTIQVDARDLTTDDSFRNRALRRQILDSAQDDYQYITFIPTEINGLNAQPAEIGETQIFSLTGDLQIRDIVQIVTFEMTVTAISESELRGSGEAIVLRSDFDLQIPSVPGVANVSDEIKLEIEFTAEST